MSFLFFFFFSILGFDCFVSRFVGFKLLLFYCFCLGHEMTGTAVSTRGPTFLEGWVFMVSNKAR